MTFIRRCQRGFTFLEAFITLAIVMLLATFAIRHTREAKPQVADAAAKKQLVNLFWSMESYMLKNGSYTDDKSALAGYSETRDVMVGITHADRNWWEADAFHSQGKKTFTWSSRSGGLQQEE